MASIIQLKDESGVDAYPLTSTSTVVGLYDAINPKIGTTQPAGGFAPNVVYNLGTLAGNTSFTLATPADNTIVNHYYWTFDTPSTPPTIVWPTGLIWVGGSAPMVAASKHYEVSVISGVAAFMEA